ncbi:hypothetical protein ILYODFUR_025424 [Ilyodon furcidens]|uniref:Uncharacterized protein n=1 Tax=Ilyodon furcidens TaxID=33524 RepID=A0ABV0SP70_9TELE
MFICSISFHSPHQPIISVLWCRNSLVTSLEVQTLDPSDLQPLSLTQVCLCYKGLETMSNWSPTEWQKKADIDPSCHTACLGPIRTELKVADIHMSVSMTQNRPLSCYIFQ